MKTLSNKESNNQEVAVKIEGLCKDYKMFSPFLIVYLFFNSFNIIYLILNNGLPIAGKFIIIKFNM